MAESNENATMQVEEVITNTRDKYESQGARPRRRPNVKYNIDFLESLKPVEVIPASLQISLEDGLIFEGEYHAKISVEDFRLASMFEHVLDKHCIHVSFYNTEKNCISSIFFEVAEFGDCFSALEHFQKQKLLMYSISEAEMESGFKVLDKQPIFLGWVKANVQTKDEMEMATPEAPTEGALEYLMIVDLECISLYDSKSSTPAYQMYFWAEDTDQSVETVRHHQSQNFIMFETKVLAIVMNAVKEIIQNMRILRPKKTQLLKDVKAFLAFAPQIEKDLPFHLSDKASTSVPSQSTSYAEGGSTEVKALQVELDSALDQFKDNEDFSNMWITQQANLEELQNEGKIPTVDSKSGGLDPDDAEHFKKALYAVNDFIAENNFQVALARVTAVREIFKESKLREITEFLQGLTDMEILRRLYFRSLMQ